MIKPLAGHVSQETAFVNDNFPWGFRGRTQQRHWIETKPGKGQRTVTQTQNPATGVWCKPKMSTYSTIRVLFLDDNYQVESDGIDIQWSDEDKVLAFDKNYASVFGDYETRMMNELKRVIEIRKHMKVECKATVKTLAP